MCSHDTTCAWHKCALTVTKDAEDPHNTKGNGKDLEINNNASLELM